MVELKLYQPDELVERYLFSWHITDEQTIKKMQHLCAENTSSLQKIINTLDDHILKQIQGFTKSVSLSGEQTLALVKMIYLEEKLYQRFNIFQSKDTDILCQKLSDFHKFYAVPTAHPSEMIPQIIRVYNPLRTLRQFVQKGLKNVFRKK